jgi:hypothetical protein
MSENEKPETKPDDEISLVDLFVVLLKYRVMIIVVAVIGIIAGGAYFVVNPGSLEGKGEAAVVVAGIDAGYEGRMSVVVNPRLARESAERFPDWFESRELLEVSLEEAGYTFDEDFKKLGLNNRAYSVDISFKTSKGKKEPVELLLTALLRNAETLALLHYTPYAEDIVAFFESAREAGREYTTLDYVRYRWARDLLMGEDTVLKLLYPPLVTANAQANAASVVAAKSPLATSVVIVFAALFLAVFLAFGLNALKNIKADDETMAKIHEAIDKKPHD